MNDNILHGNKIFFDFDDLFVEKEKKTLRTDRVHCRIFKPINLSFMMINTVGVS
jgi:hypothetical protein